MVVITIACLLSSLLALAPILPPGTSADGKLASLVSAGVLSAARAQGAETFQVGQSPFSEMTPCELHLYLAGQTAQRPDPVARLLDVSARFLGTPYMASPLGEGRGRDPDPDPVLRFDGVDCTTFVEQSLALARARSLPEALGWLRLIRYLDGRMDYSSRKHFMMAQWIPRNQAAGFMEDITERVAGGQTVWVEKRLDRAVWQRRRQPAKWPQLLDEQVPEGLFRLPIVPIERVLDLAGRIPAGTLVNVVRNDLRNHPVRVTHQGIIVLHGGRRFLRHAGRSGYGRVVDEDLAHFVGRNRAYRKWVVDGFNLQRLIPEGRSHVKSR
jgi:hypothetical protein